MLGSPIPSEMMNSRPAAPQEELSHGNTSQFNAILSRLEQICSAIAIVNDRLTKVMT